MEYCWKKTYAKLSKFRTFQKILKHNWNKKNRDNSYVFWKISEFIFNEKQIRLPDYLLGGFFLPIRY